MRKSPRLVKKNIEAQRKLFLEVGDITEAEYENIQLENENEDECHPIDDDRSPVCSEDEGEDLDLGQVKQFVNNFFDDGFWKIFEANPEIVAPEIDEDEAIQQGIYADA
ncbi:hypothetical protein MKW94_025619, partial [Papaver nudicaule]|nr:hypothetical protein [Papaver nudicaule]